MDLSNSTKEIIKEKTLITNADLKVVDSRKVVIKNKDIDVFDFAKIENNFRQKIVDFKAYIISSKKVFDEFDESSPNDSQIVEFINENKTKFSDIDHFFFEIWEMYEKLKETNKKLHQVFFQRELLSYFVVSPYTKRIYEKPLGYPGDYQMMLYIYNDGYEGDTTFGKFIHRYSLSLPISPANYNRRYYFKDLIMNAVSNEKQSRVASIACGPGVEIMEFIKDSDNQNVVISCLDAEQEALELVEKNVKSFSKKNINVQLFKNDVLDLFKIKRLDAIIDDQDLIYSTGLMDYFSDRMAKKIIEVLYKKLNPQGTLVIGNVSSGYKHRAYTELLGEWCLFYRGENEMLELTSGIEDANVRIEFEPKTKMNIFLVIEKK